MTYDLNTPGAANLWPYHPDWSQGFEVTRSFLGDQSQSRSGYEQRRSLRDTPRFSARYRTVVEGDDLREANHFLRARQNQPAAVPDFSRLSALTASSSAGASVLTIATPPAWAAAARLLVLCNSTNTELVEVVSVVGSTITLVDPLAHAWPGGSWIRPAIHGLLNGNTSATRYHRGAAQLSVEIAAYPGGEPVEAEGAATDTFNGYEVFTAEPDWSGSPSLNYLWPVEQVDYLIGRTAQFRPIEFPQRGTDAQFSGLSVAEAAAIEQTFLRMKGRRGAFYRPTMEKDFKLAASALSGATAFLAAGTDLANDLGSIDYAANPAAIEVVMTSGTRLRRLVTGITVSGGNSNVAVNAAWGVALSSTAVARISWMPLVRFGGDDLVTRWRSPVSASISCNFQSVRA